MGSPPRDSLTLIDPTGQSPAPRAEPEGSPPRDSLTLIDPTAFTAALLARVEVWIDRYIAAGLPAVIPAWHARMAPGLAVRAVIDGAPVEGEAAGLDDDGALLLRDASGRLHRIRSGDVDVIRVIAPGAAAEEPAARSC